MSGADDFYALSQRLKAAGRTDLRRELSKALRDAAKPLIADTRAAARRDLPQRGGLAAAMARKPQRVRVRTGARTAGVSIVLSKTQSGITGGTIRHPVFGNRDRYVSQRIDGEWWDDTLAAGAPTVIPELMDAMNRVARRITND